MIWAIAGLAVLIVICTALIMTRLLTIANFLSERMSATAPMPVHDRTDEIISAVNRVPRGVVQEMRKPVDYR